MPPTADEWQVSEKGVPIRKFYRDGKPRYQVLGCPNEEFGSPEAAEEAIKSLTTDEFDRMLEKQQRENWGPKGNTKEEKPPAQAQSVEIEPPNLNSSEYLLPDTEKDLPEQSESPTQ